MDYAEWADHAFTLGREHIANDGEGAIACAAVRLDQRLGRRANARTAHRIADQTAHRLLELAARAHLDGGAVGEKGLRNLAEVLHVRTEDDRLAVKRRLEDVVAARGHEAAADEDHGGDLKELGELADRIEHDDLLARLGIDAQVGERTALGVVDYRDGTMVGVRSEDALIRVYGRDLWGWPVGVGVHSFAGSVDEAAWRAKVAA